MATSFRWAGARVKRQQRGAFRSSAPRNAETWSGRLVPCELLGAAPGLGAKVKRLPTPVKKDFAMRRATYLALLFALALLLMDSSVPKSTHSDAHAARSGAATLK